MTNLRLPRQYDERLFQAVRITGLQGPYYNWNRWYLPSMGRYMKLDPIAARGGFNGMYGPNWYGFAEGNPLRRADPSGLKGGDHPSEGQCIAAGNNPLVCRQVPPKDVPPWSFDRECWADCYSSTNTMCSHPDWLSFPLWAKLGFNILSDEAALPVGVACLLVDDAICQKKCTPKAAPKPPPPPACPK